MSLFRLLSLNELCDCVLLVRRHKQVIVGVTKTQESSGLYLRPFFERCFLLLKSVHSY